MIVARRSKARWALLVAWFVGMAAPALGGAPGDFPSGRILGADGLESQPCWLSSNCIPQTEYLPGYIYPCWQDIDCGRGWACDAHLCVQKTPPQSADLICQASGRTASMPIARLALPHREGGEAAWLRQLQAWLQTDFGVVVAAANFLGPIAGPLKNKRETHVGIDVAAVRDKRGKRFILHSKGLLERAHRISKSPWLGLGVLLHALAHLGFEDDFETKGELARELRADVATGVLLAFAGAPRSAMAAMAKWDLGEKSLATVKRDALADARLRRKALQDGWDAYAADAKKALAQLPWRRGSHGSNNAQKKGFLRPIRLKKRACEQAQKMCQNSLATLRDACMEIAPDRCETWCMQQEGAHEALCAGRCNTFGQKAEHQAWCERSLAIHGAGKNVCQRDAMRCNFVSKASRGRGR